MAFKNSAFPFITINNYDVVGWIPGSDTDLLNKSNRHEVLNYYEGLYKNGKAYLITLEVEIMLKQY